MAAAGIQAAERRRLYLCGLLAAFIALGSFLLQAQLLSSHYWMLILLPAGFAFSYFLPPPYQQNVVYAVSIVAFIVAGVLIAGLREELDPQVILSTYHVLAAALLLISAFKIFKRAEMWLVLGIGALLMAVTCSMRPDAATLAAAALFLGSAGAALYRPRLRRSAAARG